MVNADEQTLRTVFLDRDGVLNEKMPEGCYVTRWEEFQILAGVPEAIARLNRAGLRVIVVSNQRGVALGLYALADVEAIHATFLRELQSRGAQVDAFYFCPHDKRSCTCRKPLPGMFEQAVAQFPQIEAASSVMIGDSLSDMEFGRRLGEDHLHRGLAGAAAPRCGGCTHTGRSLLQLAVRCRGSSAGIKCLAMFRHKAGQSMEDASLARRAGCTAARLLENPVAICNYLLVL